MRGTCGWIVVLAAIPGLSGCFSPSYRDCQLTCPGPGDCPDGFSCVAGYCRATEAPDLACEAVLEPTVVDAGPDVADAHSEPSEHDAGRPPAPPDAEPEPTCDADATPPVHPCGGSVLCAKKIEAGTVKARVIYAEKVHTSVLSAECVIESGDEKHWEHGANEEEIEQASVDVEVIYAIEVRAERVEATEIRAKEVKLDR